MEVKSELDFHQKVVDFIVEKNPELKSRQFGLNVVGEEAPSTFIISVNIVDETALKSIVCLLLYECSVHGDTPKSSINLSYILRPKHDDNKKSIIKDGEEICSASLSSDRQFLGLTLSDITGEDLSYSCCIINTSRRTLSYDQSRLHVLQSFNRYSKIQFIQTRNITMRVGSPITSNNSFFKLQSTHILYSIDGESIKYQRVLMSPNSAVVENENILSTKLQYHDLKSELERLYIFERLINGNFNLKAFQIIWPQSEEEESKIFEFQLLFSYEVQFPSSQFEGRLFNEQVLEHSSGAICLCYELKSSQCEDNDSCYAYSIHLINSNNIVECRTPSYATDPPGKILFTMYKSYIVVFTKYFIHLIDIYCHAKQICSYMWPTCFTEQQFLNLRCINAAKLSNMYFLQETRLVLSVKANLYNIAMMIKNCSSVTQKVGAVNFIVYNHRSKGTKNDTQAAVECMIFDIKNSFTVSRLMEEYITASVNRYLRNKVSHERSMKYISNTTLTGQFSGKLSSIVSAQGVIVETDLIKINLQTINRDAIVIFVKENLRSPQISRFFRLRNDSDLYKSKIDFQSNPENVGPAFDSNKYPEEADLPNYLAEMTLTEDQTRVLDESILQTLSNINKSELINPQSFVEKIRICTVRAWKKILILIHKSVFNETLWKDLHLLNRPTDPKIKCFHCAIGAFRYFLLKEKLPVPSSIEEIYILTSYNVLSDERFLMYLTYNDFICVCSISLEFFKQFYHKSITNPKNAVLARIKDRILSKMSLDSKMAILSLLNKEDQSRIIKEHWDNVNRQTNIFSKYYGEIISNVSRSCDTPQNALEQFYKQSGDRLQFNEMFK